MSVPKVKSIYLEVKSPLFVSDIPLVVLLSRKVASGEQHYIACAIPDDFGGLDRYFAVRVSRPILLKYWNEQCDLRYLYEYAIGQKYYSSPDLSLNEKGKVRFVEYNEALTEELLPEPRFFASSHTEDYGLEPDLGIEQRILIDGNWDMQEFGSFYSKFADIYSFEQALRYVIDGEGSRTDKVRRAFAAKPFKGGSSYSGFFNDLFELIPVRERPVLEGIEYHSPGHVDLRGNDEILSAVRENIEKFLVSYREIHSAHDDLRIFMSSKRMLNITGKNVELSAIDSGMFEQLTQKFYELLPIGNSEEVLALTNGDRVVCAKVGLGVFRRLQAAAKFFAQGRLSYEK